jgi:hypothetical protein
VQPGRSDQRWCRSGCWPCGFSEAQQPHPHPHTRLPPPPHTRPNKQALATTPCPVNSVRRGGDRWAWLGHRRHGGAGRRADGLTAAACVAASGGARRRGWCCVSMDCGKGQRCQGERQGEQWAVRRHQMVRWCHNLRVEQAHWRCPQSTVQLGRAVCEAQPTRDLQSFGSVGTEPGQSATT